MDEIARPFPRLLAAVLLAGLVASCATACNRSTGESPQNAEPRRPNIIFVLIDTLRADRLGSLGSPDVQMPNLDALAAEGVVFERAVAQAPWTQPSMASLLCSCYPAVHGVLDFQLAMDASAGKVAKVAVFDDAFHTLTEALRDGGYETAAFVANPFLLRDYGFAQGFTHFDASFARNTTPGSIVNRAALAWLAQRDSSKPLFLYLHYMDVHGPYDAGPRFLDPLLDRVEHMPDKHPLSSAELKALDYLRRLPAATRNPERHLRLMGYREYWVARYDAGVREADHYLGQLRDRLEEMGIWGDAYVIVTADHGEALCEHGLWDHGLSLHHTDLHVPLVLRWPGVLPAAARVPGTVRLIDVKPTLLAQLGLPPDPGDQGRSLSDVIAETTGNAAGSAAGGRQRGSPPAFAEGVKWGPKQRAIYLDAWKMILTLQSGRRQLFDLHEDPLELDDLSETHPARLTELAKALDAIVHQNAELARRSPARVELSPEEEERLRALGYMP